MIDALLYLGELLPEDLCYAVPLDMPRVAVLRAIVDEIEDAYPSIEEQHFRALALDVLQYKCLAASASVPCRAALVLGTNRDHSGDLREDE